MPHYDESFIHDDNLNQRRNKRSYHVYKHGLNPLSLLERSDVLHALEERGTSVIKRNIRNIKQRGARKPPNVTYLTKSKSPDIIIDHCPRISCFDPTKYYDIRNNNVSLASCKSLDNLTLNHVKKTNDRKIRSGASLQNLVDEERLQHYASPMDENNGGTHKGDIRSYCFSEARRKPMQRRFSRGVAAPGVGVYRQINSEGQNHNKTNEGDLCSGESGSGHRGSLRGANKLARRARSFKDDLLERISNMRSPQQQHHAPHLSSGLRLLSKPKAYIRTVFDCAFNTTAMRNNNQQKMVVVAQSSEISATKDYFQGSHSPLSPKLRNMGTKTTTVEEGEVTPAKELERLVKDVTFGLKHFSDVITKRKLEMLPDNGTLVFESIANIHKAIKPYCSRSPQLTNAVKRLCSALAMLIRLCDDITAISLRDEVDEGNQSLQPEHVSTVVKGVTQAVEDVAKLAKQYMARPALDPRPAALVSPRPNTQRNSLPDIPLTPKERSLLTGSGGVEGGGVRASHSSESVLDAPDSPPPKPARPNRKMELAPPLPPKRKSNDNSLLALSIDGLSLQSHSSGSLDSMLNVSNDEETRNANDSTNHDHVFATTHNSDIVGVCMCNNGLDGRTSLDSTHESNNSSHAHSHSNHNRFSNESGFVSVGHQEQSSEHSFTSAFSSHHYSSHTDSTFDSTDFVSEMKCTRQSFESRMNMINANCVTSNITAQQHSSQNININSSRLASVTSDETETPPELPAKTRRNVRADVQQHFPNVEIRPSPICSLHGEGRPHTLADHHPPRPPPLPLKKKHIMAYMEMFGKQLEQNNAAQNPDMFRHSIHTYGLASGQHTTAGSLSVQRQQHVQRSIAQSLTIQHFGTTPLSGSEDSVSMTTSSGTSPIPPPEPPALPPKMNKNKQIQMNSSNELLPPPSPRPSSYTSSSDETVMNNVNSEDPYESAYKNMSTPGKFPLEDELEILVQPMPSPVPSQRSQRSESSTEPTVAVTDTSAEPVDADDVILHTDISSRLVFNTDKEGPEVKGGQPDALVVLATKATKDFAYQEAFLATYRTWLTPKELVERLIRRANHFRPRPHELRSTLSLLTRVVADLTMVDLESKLMQKIMNFIYWLVEVEELAIAKALRQILVDKQKQLHSQQQTNHRYEYDSPCSGAVSLSRDTLLDFKSHEVAEQMTLLDAALFARITTAEVLSWPRDQSEESSPNLTRFTAHFNNMSYWARSRILEQVEGREREKYANKFLKVMKVLRKINNFNSYLALVSALDSPPVRRLGWPRSIEESVREHCALIDSSCSFRAYRTALAETSPPCIPYIGLVLQDLTFVHVGNPDHLPEGSINFSKRWQQYHIMENMKRFQKQQYKFKRNERIQAMFNEFDDVLSEDAMWQISKTIKPSDGRSAN